MQFFEEGDGLYLSLQIGTIFKEIAFMELIELVPHFLCIIFSLLVHLLGNYYVILG